MIRIIGIIVASIAAMYFMKKFVESVINLSVSLKKRNYYDKRLQHQGIVFNKRTKKLEADNSLILPF